ncbi:MAG: DUF4340 domain-containing protein [Verrucomicrobia bacterium]|nr:DUF4340 domain-containing protein [Verrucomicrobiota bacterium]
MNSKTTWGLLALAMALLGYILIFERRNVHPAGNAAEAERVFPDFDPAKVTAIGIERTNSYLGVERVNNRWQLSNPVYPAQSTGIEEFLQSIALLQKHASIPAHSISSQPGGRAAFGLQPPKAKIAVYSGTNRIGFDLGSRTPTADQLYVQLIGDPRILITDAGLLEHVPTSARDWRDLMLVHDERLTFDQLAVTNETSFFWIVRDATNQLWTLARPVAARANGNAVDYVIQELRNTRVSQFVTDDPAADLERYGLQPPKVQMTLARGTNAVLQLQFGSSPTNNLDFIYARRLSHTNVVLVPRKLADLLRKSHDYYRDRTLLYFSEPSVRRIEIQSKREAFALQIQTNGAWQMVEPFRAPADTAAVREFFTNLARLEIDRFEKDLVPDFAPYGLAPGERRYILKTAVTNAIGPTNIVLAQVAFGSNQVDRIFARRGEEPAVYTVSLGDVSRLPQAAFEWRDRRLWSFASSNVVSVTVHQRGRTRKLERNAQRAWFSEAVENEALEELLRRLGELRAVSWRGKGEEQMRLRRFHEYDYQITLDVNRGGKIEPHTIRFGPLVIDGPLAAVVLEEGQWIIFVFPAPMYQDVVRALSFPEAAQP